ncbi:MAG: efflux RND transporter periplasmic adaptor subunit [Gemmatimonadetes bacterium]|nr:efflux RND transporter periplasmic adaptor subunit [Gemmatimonadota bacterium]
MTRKAKIAAGIGLVVVVGAGAGVGMSARGRAAVPVRIEAAAKRDLVAYVTASGWIRPHRKVDVQSDIMGRVIDLRVKEGDAVKRGDILLRIDPTQYEAAVARARAAVSEALARAAQARANQIQAQRNYERSREIYARDSMLVSKQALEDAQTQARVQAELAAAADYGVEQARAALREAEDQLAKTVIRSPMDGVVTRLQVEEGETAIVGTMNNPGSLLLTISDLSNMEAVVRVDETDVPQLHIGDTASVSIDAFPHQKFRGRVTEISHSAVRSQEQNSQLGQSAQQAVDFEVVVTLDSPPTTLRPDLSATADIVTATRKDALTIPIIALTVRERGNVKPLPQEDPAAKAAADRVASERRDDQEGVFVVRQGKAHFVPVTVGIAGREHFEVISGLSVGDSVVAGPYEAIRSLEEGKPVKRMTLDARTKGAKPKGAA